MKKILKLFVLGLIAVGAASFASCNDDDTTEFNLYGFTPNPAIRGEALIFHGEGLSAVNLVRFGGGAETSEITRDGGSISVIIPMTAQPGVIELCFPGGSYITRSALELDEPLETDAELLGYTDFESKTNGATVVGRKYFIATKLQTDYLSDIVRVEFEGEDAVVEYDAEAVAAAGGEEASTDEELVALSKQVDFVRGAHLVIVTIPETAKSGAVRLYNSTDDRFTAPDIELAQSMAESVEPSTDVIPGLTRLTVTGENFDLVTSVTFTGGLEVTLGEQDADGRAMLTVADDGRSLEVMTKLGMQDGALSLHTKSGDVIATPAVETVVPTPLYTWAQDDRYKAGENMTLSYTAANSVEVNFRILTQIEQVLFYKADGSAVETAFEANEEYGCLNITVPAEAVDGKLDVVTYAGKQTSATETLVLVKAVATGCDTEVNGGEEFTVTGTDLDLVTSVKLAGQSCAFRVDEAGDLKVATERTYASGEVVLAQANGVELKAADRVEILAVGDILVTSMPAQAVQGAEITIEGRNFNMIESIYLGDSKVTSYTSRSDTSLSFIIPVDVPSGAYVLTFNLTTGAVETTTQEIVIAQTRLTETAIWEGELELPAGWGTSLQLPASIFAGCTTETLFTLYFVNNGSGQFQFKDSNWNELESPHNSPWWNGVDPEADDTSYSFTLSAGDLEKVLSGGMIIGGQNVTLTRLTIMVEEIVGDSKVEPVLATDIMLNDYEEHGGHNCYWDGSWSDGSATEFCVEDGNTYLRTSAPVSGWIVNCNHQDVADGAFGAAVDDLSRYVVKFDLKIESGVTGCSSVPMQVVLGDGWFWYGEGFFPESTDGDWMTVTISWDGLTGACDTTTGTNGLYSDDAAVPAGVCIDNFRLSLK